MPKELYIYSGIYDWTAESFIRDMEENKNSDIRIRVNTNGGSPSAAWGMVAKMREHKKKVEMQVDAKAISAGFFMLPFASYVKALDVSYFLVHRAAYSENYEKNFMTAEEKEDLKRMNSDLRKALEAKIDSNKFALVTGITFDQIFDHDNRIDVRLTAKQAKDVGLVDEIVPLTDTEATANGKFLFLDFPEDKKTPEATKTDVQTSLNNNVMTKEDFKLKHPDAYAAIVKEGVEAERDRVGALMVYNDIDPETVAKKVKDGSSLSQTDMAELGRKAFSKEALKNIAADSTKEVKTEEVSTKVKTESEKQIEAFASEVGENLGLNKKA
jgi:ATP-dependent protease ClpP protease subunit